MDTSVLSVTPETMRSGAAAAVRMLKMLANEDRLLLLCQLSQGESCVSDLEAALGIRQPTLSQQLAVLRSEELVSACCKRCMSCTVPPLQADLRLTANCELRTANCELRTAFTAWPWTQKGRTNVTKTQTSFFYS